MDAVTEPPVPGERPAARSGASAWVQGALWLCAWNAVVPLRLVQLLLDPGRPPGYIEPVMTRMMLQHTSWAIATFVMFRLALRARHEPLRRVLAILGVLAVPLVALRFWVTIPLDRQPRPNLGVLWFVGPVHLLPLVGAAALGLLVVYMQRERDGAVRQATLQAALASARLQTLRLQLNPHFLFNALNSIASLVHIDAAKADAAIAALSAFLRASLSVANGEEATLEHELRLVDAYLEIEVLRFEWLTVDLDVPDALRSACVPSFVLQLLVENAIRHGLAPSRTPGRVLIAARRDGDRLELRVSDDGVGLGARSADASLGIGLQNVSARLAQLHGPDGTLALEPATPHGTVATVRIPFRECPSAPAPNPADA